LKYYFFLLPLILLFSCNGGGGGGSKPSVEDGNNSSSANDPLSMYAWHLENTGQTTFSSSQGEAGYDLRMKETFRAGIYGDGVRILVSDSGVEGTHEDLKDNFSNTNFDYRTPSPFISSQALPSNEVQEFGDPHGTMVAGIIAAASNNNIGSRGVAPKAIISSTNYLASDISPNTEIDLNQVENDFDIVNQSWGWSQCYLVTENTSYNDQVQYAGKHFRNNKGMIIVKSAGNDYNLNLLEKCNRSDIIRVGNSNYDSDNNSPEITLVSAFNSIGYPSSYSSSGANIWISAPGGEYGDTEPAILTTDRSGCVYGLSGIHFLNFFGFVTNGFDDVGDLNKECNYTSAMNGTSSAAPMVSGAVAILLESNPNLTLRDVKHILASTAYELKDKPDFHENPIINSPSGHQWEQGWITNKAGYKFHNRFGFGAVHVDNAVSMAKNNYQFLPDQLRTIDENDNWLYSSGSLSLPIPDNSSTGVSHQIYVSHNLNIEAVQIRVTSPHSNLGDIGIELVSPLGTKSIISNVNNSLDGLQNLSNNLFLSNAFYGESSGGLWTIKLIDGKSGKTGSLTNWKINIIGNLKGVSPGPVVNLSNSSTNSSLTTSPTISWGASLTGSVASYEYALGSVMGSRDIRDWTSVGTDQSFIADGLSLINGQIIYVLVRAVSDAGSYSVGRSSYWTVDVSGPGISISSPSANLTKNSNVSFSVNYTGATSISLSNSDITLNKTGTANGVVSVSGSGLSSRTVTISGITGNGTLGILIASVSALKNGVAAPATTSNIFTVDNMGPVITIGSPSSLITKNSNILFTISYDDASSVTLNSSHITLNKTGTANGSVSVSGTGSTSRTVTISGITGNGTIGISLASNTAVDSLGNTALSAGPSNTFTVDNTGPIVSISSPSQSITASSSVSYIVSYSDASAVTLSSSNITLNKSGTANGAVSVSGSGSTTRTVTISGITGNGTLGISIASGTALDSLGNLASSAGPSSLFTVDNIGPSLSISSPSASSTSAGPVSYTVTYTDANSITLNSSQITLNKTGTANGTVSVSGTGSTNRTVTISGITGDGTLGISIASGTAVDSLGNLASPAGSSSVFTVDNIGPTLSISAPSASSTSAGPVSYTVTYADATSIILNSSHITLNKTGTANGTVSVSGTGLTTRTVTISGISGNGTLGISIASGTAVDYLNNQALSSNASTVLPVDNSPPVLSISAPSKLIASTSSVSFIISSNKTVTFNLNSTDVLLNTTGTANGTVSITGTGNTNRTVTISSISGDGTIGIAVSAGVATDSIGNSNAQSSNSSVFTIGCESGSQTFNYTGVTQQFSVPAKCTALTFIAKGGAGGSSRAAEDLNNATFLGSEGLGISAKMNVAPGEIFDLYVASMGNNGSGVLTYRFAGGGGGATAILKNSNQRVLLIAGGGAGGGVCYSSPCSTVSGGLPNTNISNSTTLNASEGLYGFGNLAFNTYGGWGYRNGGIGGVSRLSTRAYGGGGGGNPGGTGGDGSNTSNRGGNYYNSSSVTNFSTTSGSSGNGIITISWE
jgi:subtilisin-like proprotein convertase family protein